MPAYPKGLRAPKKIHWGIFFPLFLIFSNSLLHASSENSSQNIQAQIPAVQNYEELAREVKLRQGEQADEGKPEDADRQETIRKAWELGRLIETYAADNLGDLTYKQELVKQLSADTGIDSDQLTVRMKFAREYPARYPETSLAWSHYKRLLNLDDAGERARLEKEGAANGWSVRDLGEKTAAANRLKDEARNKSILENKIPVNEQQRVYDAEINEVNDGDTVHAVIDLGFGLLIEQRLRLNGIDAPELGTPGGAEARQFLKDQALKVNRRVTLKIGKQDKFNRYLADIWADGKYLNQEMIDSGHAVLMESGDK